MNSIKHIVETVIRAYDEIKAANQAKGEAMREADRVWRDRVREHQETLEALKAKYGRRAVDIAIPYAPVLSGFPDTMQVTPEGIDMRWGADHPNDEVEVLIKWEELVELSDSM